MTVLMEPTMIPIASKTHVHLAEGCWYHGGKRSQSRRSVSEKLLGKSCYHTLEAA